MGGSFPLLILMEVIEIGLLLINKKKNLMEDRIGEELGMLPNTKLEAAHLTIWCARKFAFLATFDAFQF
jgi:hypothetical protein